MPVHLLGAAVGAMVASATVAVAQPSSDRVGLSPLFLTGDSAPDLHPPGRFTGLEIPAINDAGDIAFSAGFERRRGETGWGIWRSEHGRVHLVIRGGQDAPGLPGLAFDRPRGWLNLADDGAFTFAVDLAGPGVNEHNRRALYLHDSEGTHLLRRTSASGVDGGYTTPLLTVGSRVAFGTWSGYGWEPTDTAMWYGAPPNFQRVAFASDAAPGPRTHRVIGYPEALSARGELYFIESALSPGLPASVILWRHDGAGLTDAAVAPQGVYFMGASTNDAGLLAVEARPSLSGPSEGQDGIYLVQPSGLHPLAPLGIASAGLYGGLEGVRIDRWRMNASGTLLMSMLLEPPTSHRMDLRVVVRGNQAGYEVIAQVGQTPPGADSALEFLSFDAVALNARNDAVIHGFADRRDGLPDATAGLWAVAPDGSVRLILTNGLEVEIGPTDTRTIMENVVAAVSTTVGIGGGEDGAARFLNDSGTLAVRLPFTDDTSGIFLANLAGPLCPVDLDGDADADVHDILVFIHDWVRAEPAADFNDDGQVDVRDLIAFIDVWHDGCAGRGPPGRGR